MAMATSAIELTAQADGGSIGTEDFEALVEAALGGQALDWGRIKRELASLPAASSVEARGLSKRSPVNPLAPVLTPAVLGTCALLKTVTLPIFPVAWPPIYKGCFVLGNLSTGLGR